jgi:hypothetical protein
LEGGRNEAGSADGVDLPMLEEEIDCNFRHLADHHVHRDASRPTAKGSAHFSGVAHCIGDARNVAVAKCNLVCGGAPREKLSAVLKILALSPDTAGEQQEDGKDSSR